MSGAEQMHTRAMDIYDKALAARRAGDEAGFMRAVVDALELETAAAEEFAIAHGAEPTRSVLYRSAATIAMTGRQFGSALKLASAGLATEAIPPAIRAELVALVKDANYRLHVQETDGVTIGDESIIMSLEGEAVGNGMVKHDVFKAKLNSLVNIINRTFDRVSGAVFGDSRDKEFTTPLYVSPPIPGSFAIEVRLGEQKQPDLNGIPPRADVNAVLEEVVECFQDFKDGDLEALRQRFSSDEYFTNFMALGRALQPDGAKITAVELVGHLHKGVRRVRLTTPRSQPARKKREATELEIREVTGVLRVAEKRGEGKERVEIMDDDGRWHDIHVPAALMADVVRPLWDARVTITARVGKRNVLELETIDAAEQ